MFLIGIQRNILSKGDNKTLEEENKKINWAGFVETTIVNFFQENELEKLSLEDGKGNKAKLSKQKDNVIKVECTSTTTL